MNSIFKAVLSFFKGILSVFHLSNTDEASTKLFITIGVQETLVDHPEAKDSIISMSQLIIDGIDGKDIVESSSIMNLLKAEIEKSHMDMHLRILVNGLMLTYADQLAQYLDKNKIVDATAQLSEVRKFAILVNLAAGGSAK